MQITRKQWAVAGAGFVIAVVAFLGWTNRAGAPAPTDTPAATTTESGTPTEQTAPTTAVRPFTLNAADTPAAWNFKGAYTGNDVLVAQANADIAHLTSLTGKGEYDDYDLYNGIANDYGLLGDGKTAYQYYQRSIQVHPAKGLAYVNLAHLMDQLGAYYTAADAYAKAVAVEPGVLEYHIERLTYLTRQFGSDNARITAALTDASKQFGDTAPILKIEAQWLTAQKRYADAINAWETVKTLSSGQNTTAIDTEIARLRAKQ